jgi:hypothetical protein
MRQIGQKAPQQILRRSYRDLRRGRGKGVGSQGPTELCSNVCAPSAVTWDRDLLSCADRLAHAGFQV